MKKYFFIFILFFPNISFSEEATTIDVPTVDDLHLNGRNFPPNFLHESWMDYLYWDVELLP